MRVERGWSWPSVPHVDVRAQGLVILGPPPLPGSEEPATEDSFLVELLSVDPGLVGFFLVSAKDHDAASMTSMEAEAARRQWNLAIVDPDGTYGPTSAPGLVVVPARATPYVVDVGPLPPSADPLEIALEVMRPDLLVGGYCARSWPTTEHANLVTVSEGIGLASLHLRRRGVFLLEASPGIRLQTDKGSFYRAGAQALLPGLRQCHDVWRVAWLADIEDRSTDGSARLVRIGTLLTSVEQRVMRTLQARDRFRWGTDYVSGNEDDVHLDLDSVLVALQGAVDAAVRAIDLAAGVGSGGRDANWRHQRWRDALAQRWPRLASLYREDEMVRATISLLADFRNRIHSYTWGYVRNGRADQSPHEMEIWIRCDDEKVPEFRSSMRLLGGRERWRWHDISQTSIHLDPVSVVEELTPLVAAFLSSALAQMAVDWREALSSSHLPGALQLRGSDARESERWSDSQMATQSTRPPPAARPRD